MVQKKIFGLLLLKRFDLIETKNNYKYQIGYLDDVTRPLVLVLYKRRGYFKTFIVKDGDEDHNKLISFHINDEKLLEKYKTISTKIEDLKSI